MNNQAALWMLTVGLLMVAFLLRAIQKERRRSGHAKIFELGNENIIYAHDDDEL